MFINGLVLGVPPKQMKAKALKKVGVPQGKVNTRQQSCDHCGVKNFSFSISVIGTCTTPGQYLTDSTYCRVFYECDEDLIPQPYQCDEGLCWYQAATECVWDNEGLCSTPCT